MEIIDLLNQGTEANTEDAFRYGNLIRLPDKGSVVISGDIHGHSRNLERIIAFTDLQNNPDRHLVLQEIIHGGDKDTQGFCLSYKVLFDAVRLKLRFPDRVHIIMGNHDTAHINDSRIIKNGKEMNHSMLAALDNEFGDKSGAVKEAIKQFLLSQPLAVRCDNRIWISHSLPGARYADKFDGQIFDRKLTADDCKKPGSAYLLTWGRNHSRTLLAKMAQLFDVDIFILGHQAQLQGFSRAGENLLIIASDHGHGCLIPVDLSKSYTIEMLTGSIVPLASIS